MKNSVMKSAEKLGEMISESKDLQGETGLRARIADRRGRTLCAMDSSWSFRIPTVVALAIAAGALTTLTVCCITHCAKRKRNRHPKAVYCQTDTEG